MPDKFFQIILIFISCIIVINKGLYSQVEPAFELNSIEFKGNSKVPSPILKSVIYSQETPWWFWKFLNSFTPFGNERVYFDSSDIQLDLEALKDYYNANGFFKAAFSYEFTIDSSSQDVDLVYNIYENEFSKYGKIVFFGLDSVPSGIFENIETDLTLDSTKRFIQDEVQQNINNSVEILSNSGYPFVTFDSTLVVIDTVTNYANLNIFFTTGKLMVIDTLIVKKEGVGAHEVEDKDIRGITGLTKDEPYSKAEIRIAQERLSRTGLFNSLSITPYDSIKTGSRIPLILKGNIGSLNELSPEIIVNNQQNALNVGLGASYIRKNFFGKARKLTAKVSFGLQDIFNVDYQNLVRNFSFRDTTLLGYVDARVSIEQPNLFNEPVYGILENYLTIDKQQNYNLTRYGSKITFDFELPAYTLISFFSTYYNVEQSDEVFRTNSDSLSRKLLSIIGFNIGRTTANSILFPTRGYSISLQFEEANSLPYLITKITGDSYNGSIFYRLLLSTSYYEALDVQRNLIFAAKFRSGYLRAFYGDYAGLPINKTFFAGGGNSIRGWRPNQLPWGDVPKENGENAKGGTFLLEGSIEMRYRFLENIGTALFFDYGNVWINYKDFTFDGIAGAIGTGLRYYTEVAPFRLDFGFKLYDPFSKKFLWDSWKPGFFKNLEFHFGIGEAF